MGGRGTFAAGNNVAYQYETVGTIEGVKVLEKINKKSSTALPEEAHKSSAYILIGKDGEVRQYREFNADHTAKFDIDYLDCEFAGNNVNIGLLEENADLIGDKKIGFGCLDSASNSVDEEEKVRSLVERGIKAIGAQNMFLDPDCGLRKVDLPIAERKVKIMTDLAKELE